MSTTKNLKISGTPSGEGFDLTVYPSSRPNTDTIYRRTYRATYRAIYIAIHNLEDSGGELFPKEFTRTSLTDFLRCVALKNLTG